MSTESREKDQTLWTIKKGSIEQYWIDYEAARPNYADSKFLELIYDYHNSKLSSEGASFLVAHDVACGAGKAGRELAKRFDLLIASDSNSTSLNAMRISCGPDVGNINYLLCSAENIAQHASHASADLIVAAEVVPILNMPTALDSFAKVLRPNGTLAMWFYGRMHFVEDKSRKTCQPILDEIMEIAFYQVVHAGTTKNRETWAGAAQTMASWLDNVRMPTHQWRLVQRHKWNTKLAEMSMGAAAEGLGIVRTSAIADGQEAVIEKQDGAFWQRRNNIENIKDYVKSAYPGLATFVDQNARISQLFDDLAKAMGGKEERKEVTWPVSLIIATPRKRPA